MRSKESSSDTKQKPRYIKVDENVTSQNYEKSESASSGGIFRRPILGPIKDGVGEFSGKFTDAFLKTGDAVKEAAQITGKGLKKAVESHLPRTLGIDDLNFHDQATKGKALETMSENSEITAEKLDQSEVLVAAKVGPKAAAKDDPKVEAKAAQHANKEKLCSTILVDENITKFKIEHPAAVHEKAPIPQLADSVRSFVFCLVMFGFLEFWLALRHREDTVMRDFLINILLWIMPFCVFFGHVMGQLNATKTIKWMYNENLRLRKRVTQLEMQVNSNQLDSISCQKRQSFLKRASFLITEKVTADRDKDALLPDEFFSVLQDRKTSLAEETKICDSLMNRLLKVDTFSKSPDGQKVKPICTWLGNDYLLTDSPEDPIYRNKYLNRVGIRDTPLFVFNAVMPWANIVLYFQMPAWVKTFDQIEVDESDTEEIKCYKRFLINDDEYRRLRLQFLPCIVECPSAVRIIAPAKKELIGRAALLPSVSWYRQDETVDKFGEKRCALMEATADMSQTAFCRSVARIIRRNIESVSIDVAWVIDKPELQKEYEPACCLGMCKMDHVDISRAPILPPPSKEEEIRVASFVASKYNLQ